LIVKEYTMNRRIKIFDTTLRDGEQVPGAKLNAGEKIMIARQLVRLGVDVIEAGFPASSPGDFNAVKLIAQQVKGPVITALARTVKADIDAVWESVKYSERPRIHMVLGTSDIHVKRKLTTNREKCMEMGVEAVRYARSLTNDVEYSTEDATRSNFDYLCRVMEAVIKAGATTVNIPDTVGYAVPDEFGALIRRVRERVPATDRVTMSVHCHNDLGLATINTIAAIENGVDQVEVTVNGIGERAGNAALEEVVMILNTRKSRYRVTTGIDIREIIRTSRMVSEIMNVVVQPNKAIVGANAFAHSSGIHQDGVLKARSSYEIISPEAVGAQESQIVLTARSGKHAVKYRMQKLGYRFSDEVFRMVHKQFLAVADSKKEVLDEDLVQIAEKAVEQSGAVIR
jgi:2-isopropylmalate synthase